MDYFFFDCVYFFVFFKGCGDHRDLPSFPTRRSSDLNDSEGRPSLWSSQASWKALAGSKPTKSANRRVFSPGSSATPIPCSIKRSATRTAMGLRRNRTTFPFGSEPVTGIAHSPGEVHGG